MGVRKGECCSPFVAKIPPFLSIYRSLFPVHPSGHRTVTVLLVLPVLKRCIRLCVRVCVRDGVFGCCVSGCASEMVCLVVVCQGEHQRWCW